jgi:hypothetical protein
VRLNNLYKRYGDKAHPHDGWRVPNNLIEDINYYEPTTDDERTEVAAACQVGLNLEVPMLVDRIDNNVEEKYVGLPMRQVLIDSDGKVVYIDGKGPFGWDDDAFDAALSEQLGETVNTA